jgi:hypothetical protein
MSLQQQGLHFKLNIRLNSKSCDLLQMLYIILSQNTAKFNLQENYRYSFKMKIIIIHKNPRG